MKKTIQINNAVMVSDPCYEPGTWGQGVIQNMLAGTYIVDGEILDMQTWGNRVSKISICHEDYINRISVLDSEDFIVGVDSGQAGIYDLEYYLNLWENTQKQDDWYTRVCYLTYDDEKGFLWNTIDDKGIVSSSGFGDGFYTCLTARNADGKVVYVEIDYGIEEDDFDDENENEWLDDDQ
jgi:hypothetical protein